MGTTKVMGMERRLYMDALATGASVQEPVPAGASMMAGGSVASLVADSGAMTATTVTRALRRCIGPTAQDSEYRERSNERRSFHMTSTIVPVGAPMRVSQESSPATRLSILVSPISTAVGNHWFRC